MSTTEELLFACWTNLTKKGTLCLSKTRSLEVSSIEFFMRTVCRQCQAPFEITDEDLAFYDKISPVIGGTKQAIPPPTHCPDCRMQRRLTTRNERNLYHRKCDLTGRQIVSVYASGSPHKVYQSDEWFSDKWDPRDYARDFDFSRPFFAQFAELKRAVPRMALVTSPQAEESNCMYINFAGHSKNCYMTFDSDYNEDSIYTKVVKHSKRCVDCSFVHDSELCYECVDCYNCYNLRRSQNCSNCSDSAFLRDCRGCRHCFFCVNLAQKEYHIYNKPYSKEEYEKIIAGLQLTKHSSLGPIAADAQVFALKHPRKAAQMLKAEDATGNYIHNAQRCHRCFDVADAQDLRYCDSLYKAKDCADISSFGEKIELCYESATAGIDCYHMLFCFAGVIGCSDILYCDECRTSTHCFGCVGMKHSKFCVFNKQYTEEEYGKLVPKIIEHMRKTNEWGEYFPASISSFGYNETVAQEYFPLTKEKAVTRGWAWREDDEQEKYRGPPVQLPDDIGDTGNDVCEKILACSVTGKPYKITAQEWQFYRDMGLPVPRKCPDQRHKERLALRTPRKLWQRTCAKCKAAIETTYAPDRPEIVYCESCYLTTIY